MENKELLYDVHEKPTAGLGFLLSLQHVFGMFGSAITVPLVLGTSVPTALFAAGLATLVFVYATKKQVPSVLGPSFAYIGVVAYALEINNGDIGAAQTGLMLVSLVFIILGLIINKTGTGWIDKILPPIVIGPMMIVIGLSLAGGAVENSGLVTGGDWREIVVALVTFSIAALLQLKGKGFLGLIPFLVAIVVGYIVAVFFGLVDFTPVIEAPWFQLPDLALPFDIGIKGIKTYKIQFTPEALAIVPVALATVTDHIGNMVSLGQTVGRDFTKEPGLGRTLLGSGLAGFASTFIGGQMTANYGENVGVVGMSKVASVSVVIQAAIIVMLMSFMGKVTALVATIPNAVIGGMSILLYGVIASNGFKVIVNNKIDFGNSRNLIIASAMLVLGLGGAVLEVGSFVSLTGTALTAIVGIVLNLILPKND